MATTELAVRLRAITSEHDAAIKLSADRIKALGGNVDNLNSAGRRFDMRGTMQQLSQVGQSTMATGNFVQALAIQLPDLALGFGPVGMAAGLAAGLMLPLAANLMGVGEESKSAEERMDGLRDAVDAYIKSAEAARASSADMIADFGDMADTARAARDAIAELNRERAIEGLNAEADAIGGTFGGFALGDDFTGGEREQTLSNLEEQLGVTRERALELLYALQGLADAEGTDRQGEAAMALIGALTEARGDAGALKGAFDEVIDSVAALVEQIGLMNGELERGVSLTDGRAESLAGQRAGRAMARDRLNAASGEGILTLIRQVEGTAGPNGYNTSLGNGRFLPGGVEQDLTNKTLSEIRDLQRAMLANPANTFNSSAIGAYQIVGTTLDGLIDRLDLDMNERFTPELQDRLGLELVRQRSGQGLAGFQNEWEGIRDQGVTEAQLNRALGAEVVPGIDPEVAKATAEAAKEAERQAKLSEQAREAEARAVEAAQRAYDGLRGSLDPMVAAQNAMAAGQATIKDALDRGLISVQEYDAGLTALEARLAKDQVAVALANITEGGEAAAEAMKRLQDAGEAGAERLGDLFMSVVDGSTSAKEAVGQLLMELAKVQMQKALLGLAGMNGGNNLLADLGSALTVSGARANGGPVWPGGTFLVGERGPELFAPSVAGSIIPNGQMPSFQSAAASMAGQGITLEIVSRVDRDGNIKPFVEAVSGAHVRQGLDAADKALPGKIRHANRNPRDNRAGRG